MNASVQCWWKKKRNCNPFVVFMGKGTAARSFGNERFFLLTAKVAQPYSKNMNFDWRKRDNQKIAAVAVHTWAKEGGTFCRFCQAIGAWVPVATEIAFWWVVCRITKSWKFKFKSNFMQSRAKTASAAGCLAPAKMTKKQKAEKGDKEPIAKKEEALGQPEPATKSKTVAKTKAARESECSKEKEQLEGGDEATKKNVVSNKNATKDNVVSNKKASVVASKSTDSNPAVVEGEEALAVVAMKPTAKNQMNSKKEALKTRPKKKTLWAPATQSCLAHLWVSCQPKENCKSCKKKFKPLPQEKITKKDSKINGKGLFLKTSKPIKEDTVIAHIRGSRSGKDGMQATAYTIQVGSDYIEPRGKVKFVNHSCAPNSRFQKWSYDDGRENIAIVSNTCLKGDEEVTVSYNDSKRFKYDPCNCDACRKHSM